ncbi:MAG: hypothetical protein U0667_17480 [Chloroflexota bacterium]
MARVRWADLSEKQYEDMVSVLLSHLHPDATRIDGSGGDGGRDVQILRHDGLSAFELKSFTGRMTRGRRRQVKSSLQTASGLNPRDWTLIVPIDFTPEELAWFEGLGSSVPFRIEHRGKTWLDAQLAQRPCITRYFREDAANEVARLAEVLQQEEAVLVGGAPDALERVSRVVDQLNELDPYYRFEVTASEGTRSVRIVPRYQGAETERPLRMRVAFLFPDDADGRDAADKVRRAIDFGTGVTIPPEYVRAITLDAPALLGGTYEHVELVLAPSEPEPVSRSFVLVCESEVGMALADLPVELTLRTQGLAGVVWDGADRSGLLSTALIVNGRTRTGSVKLRLSAFDSYVPTEVWPLVRFLSVLRRPNRLALLSAERQVISTSDETPVEPWVDPWLEQLVEALVLIQLTAHSPGPVPIDLSDRDVRDVLTAARLLRGEVVEGTWDRITLGVADSAPFEVRAQLLTTGGDAKVVTHDARTIEIGGVEYSLGKRTRTVYESVRVGGPTRATPTGIVVDPVPIQWYEAGAVPAGASIALVPGSTDACRLSLVTLDEGDAIEAA